MTLPRSAAPAWRKRAPLEIAGTSYPATFVDEYIRESIRRADGKCHPETGFYAELHIHGLASKEEYKEVDKALRRCALWLHRNTTLNCSVHVEPIKNADGTFSAKFVAINKDHTYAYMTRKYGDDPTKWPYSTNRFHPNYGR